MRALLVLGGMIASALGVYSLFSNKKQKIFISYYYKEENFYKNLIKAWSSNDRFEDFEFVDLSTDVSIPSRDNLVIRTHIEAEIAKCDCLLVIVGPKTHSRNWVKLEIEIARELGVRVIAVKRDKSYKSPAALKGIGADWVYGFEFKKIRRAINK